MRFRSPKIVWISVTNQKLRGPVTIFGSSEPRKFLHILRKRPFFFGASSPSHLASVAFHARLFLASFSAFVSNLPSTLSSSFGAYLGLPP